MGSFCYNLFWQVFNIQYFYIIFITLTRTCQHLISFWNQILDQLHDSRFGWSLDQAQANITRARKKICVCLQPNPFISTINIAYSWTVENTTDHEEKEIKIKILKSKYNNYRKKWHEQKPVKKIGATDLCRQCFSVEKNL